MAQMTDRRPESATLETLRKAPTGVVGLDEITSGGLPRGRPTLVTGGPGSGKSLFALEFLLHGALEFGEPGVFVAFEERPEDIRLNVASLGFDLADMEARGLLVLDHVEVDPGQISEAGAFDLEGLFIRLKLAVDSIGAKRVAIDTLEVVFGAFENQALLRNEIRRLIRWLKDEGLTAVLTAEKGPGALTRHSLEEYVSDAVILLDQRVEGQLATRRLRIVKYRGSSHGTNEYPFLIHREGMSVLPISSVGLDHEASAERVSTGIPALDGMIEGGGYFRASSVLVSGTAGSGKTSIANAFAQAATRRGERCLYFAFEESPDWIMRNMASIGMDLRTPVEEGRLRYRAARPTTQGLEAHLVEIHRLVEDFDPQVVVLDPITNLVQMGSLSEVKALLVRLLDYLKGRGTTTLYTSLTPGGARSDEETDVGISSMIDTWLLLRHIESEGERNRALHILKSRGMAHSNQVRELVFTPDGIALSEAYVGPSGVLTGSARASREALEGAATAALEREIEGERSRLEAHRRAAKARLQAIEAELRVEELELMQSVERKAEGREQSEGNERRTTRSRKSPDDPGPATPKEDA